MVINKFISYMKLIVCGSNITKCKIFQVEIILLCLNLRYTNGGTLTPWQHFSSLVEVRFTLFTILFDSSCFFIMSFPIRMFIMGLVNGSAFLEVLGSIKAPNCLTHQRGIKSATTLVALKDPLPPAWKQIFQQGGQIHAEGLCSPVNTACHHGAVGFKVCLL